MTSAVKKRKRPVNVPSWEQWQGSTLSKRLLSPEARQAGYTVTRVLPACRDLFLTLATLLLTYGDLVHKHHQFSLDTLEALAAWDQAMQGLQAALEKEKDA